MLLELDPDIYRAVLQGLPLGVYITDRQRRIAFWNTRAERITGYLGQEVIGHLCRDNILMHCDEDNVSLCENECPLAKTMQDGRERKFSALLRHKNGQRVPVRVHSTTVRDEFGAIIGAAEFFEEKSFQGTELRGSAARGDVSLDEVTAVPDRQALLEGLSAALKKFGVSGVPFGVLSMAIDNLDHLRQVNGYQAINELFYAAAQTLSAGTRPDDLMGRWQEDRFAAMVACRSADGLRTCAARLARLVSLAAVPWWGDRLSVTISWGGTMVREGDTVDSLMERAEQALQDAMSAQAGSLLVV
jgi:PAS domain S-box-containing protein/diguanylate cyclase (GGDEF)-like protein